jgi:hypothetical protein
MEDYGGHLADEPFSEITAPPMNFGKSHAQASRM